jgi:hypothetical protein
MEYIPAIHKVTVGARYPVFVANCLSYGLELDLDVHRRHSEFRPYTFLWFEQTVAATLVRTLRVGDLIEVVVIDVAREQNSLLVSLPAESAWLNWNNETVRHLARRIRATGETVLLPVLADALEEAGCTDAAMLDHCRFPQSDDRSWLVELLATQE